MGPNKRLLVITKSTGKTEYIWCKQKKPYPQSHSNDTGNIARTNNPVTTQATVQLPQGLFSSFRKAPINEQKHFMGEGGGGICILSAVSVQY